MVETKVERMVASKADSKDAQLDDRLVETMAEKLVGWTVVKKVDLKDDWRVGWKEATTAALSVGMRAERMVRSKERTTADRKAALKEARRVDL